MKYESPITCHSKDMTNVKVFADRQTDGRTGQKLYAPDLSIQGHKNSFIKTLLLYLKIHESSNCLHTS
jgi:hypothetical protein